MRLQDLVEAPPLERRGAGQQEVERAAQAVDVGADVGMRRVQRLLRGDVVRRTQHGPRVGEARVLVPAFARHLGQAEVEYLDDVPVALARRIRFCGLMSRWTMSFSKACCKPRAACWT